MPLELSVGCHVADQQSGARGVVEQSRAARRAFDASPGSRRGIVAGLPTGIVAETPPARAANGSWRRGTAAAPVRG